MFSLKNHVIIDVLKWLFLSRSTSPYIVGATHSGFGGIRLLESLGTIYVIGPRFDKVCHTRSTLMCSAYCALERMMKQNEHSNKDIRA